jgi:signal transduction histidine kinase
VVHGIVKAHDGVISVESAPGQGTRFEIYLPAAEQPSSRPPGA